MTMQSVWKSRVILIALLQAGWAGADPALEIEVFSNARFPVSGVEIAQTQGVSVVIYDLDSPRNLGKEWSAGLPGNPEQAKAVVLGRLKAIGPDEVKRRSKEAYTGLFKAFEYRIERYPAIVFDRGASVVYGNDIADALVRYRQSRSGQ